MKKDNTYISLEAYPDPQYINLFAPLDRVIVYTNRDRESDIDNKSPNIQWACVINVHWDGSGDDPSGSDEICRFTDGLLGTEVSFY